MINNRLFQVYLGENRDRERKLNNGLSQSAVPEPLLLNLYIRDLPETLLIKFCYADGIALALRAKELG